MEKAKKFFLRLEWLLVVAILFVYFLFAAKLPDSYTFNNLLDQTRIYMVDVGFMTLGTMLILVLGDIDISVSSIAGLAATILAVSYKGGSGVPFWLSIVLALAVGTICGFFNGFLVTRFKELFPMIITLSTQTLFRGIAYIILKDTSSGGLPDWFVSGLGYGHIGNFPIMLICVLVCFPIYYIMVHRTAFGRQIFATGTNITAARYSGIRTDSLKVKLFMLNGFMAALAGIFLTARTGSVKYTLANGYEMQAIAIAVLGGASTNGGKGSVIGCLLSLILMTCLKNGLKLAYNDDFILNLAIGLLLIAVILIPNIAQMIREKREIEARRNATTESAVQS